LKKIFDSQHGNSFVLFSVTRKFVQLGFFNLSCFPFALTKKKKGKKERKKNDEIIFENRVMSLISMF
jgi:hypothetical protein